MKPATIGPASVIKHILHPESEQKAFVKSKTVIDVLCPPEAGFGQPTPTGFVQKALEQAAEGRKPTPISGLTDAGCL